MTHFEKVITVKRTRDCKFGFRCHKPDCKFIHSTRGEQMGDVIGSEIKTIDISFTRVCYYYDSCYNRHCKFAHNSDFLKIRFCDKCDILNVECPFFHVKSRRELKYMDKVEYDYLCMEEKKRVFELKTKEILFDRFVLPFIPTIFIELNVLVGNTENIIIGYLSYPHKPKTRELLTKFRKTYLY